ncbi:MAG: polyhydroxybutyrate depolymerase [Pseudomonadota bacterium]
MISKNNVKQKLRTHLKESVAKAIVLVVSALAFSTSGLVKTAGAVNEDCIGNIPCQLGDRSYHVLPPDNWDGKSALPVLLHFHGWGRQGPVPVNHQHIGGAARKAGVLLIAPNGLGKSWAFWRAGSRDTDFAKEILKDVKKNYPVDLSRIYVSGYSWGSSMAWRFSCEAGNHVTVLLGISGTFYDQSEDCDTGPVEVRHVHGLKDTVMDFPYGPNGEETGPVRLWQRINGCTAEPTGNGSWETTQKFTHYVWENCSSGKSIRLDVHGGGHWIAKGWLAKQLEELVGEETSS